MQTLRRLSLRCTAAAIVLPLAVGLAACTADGPNTGGPRKSPAASSTPSESAAPALDTKATTGDQRGTVPPVNAAVAPASSKHLPAHFDFQAHRGGRGEFTEESRAAYEHALDLGVTTLETDIVMTKDGVPMVWHDPDIKDTKCSDTKPVREGDPQFPYVGKLVHELTWDQIQTLNCDKKLADFPDQQPAKGNKPLKLSQLFAVAARDPKVHFNIETKVEGEKREQSAEPKAFVDAILKEVREAGTADRVMIQSFDWRTLPMVRAQAPGIPLVALYDETTWKPKSQWTGSVDYDAVHGDVVEAGKKLGADVLSPGYTQPYGKDATDADYHPVATPDLVTKAHEAGMRVVPWTVNPEGAIQEQLNAGVDGIITDQPQRLRKILQDRGIQFR